MNGPCWKSQQKLPWGFYRNSPPPPSWIRAGSGQGEGHPLPAPQSCPPALPQPRPPLLTGSCSCSAEPQSMMMSFFKSSSMEDLWVLRGERRSRREALSRGCPKTFFVFRSTCLGRGRAEVRGGGFPLPPPSEGPQGLLALPPGPRGSPGAAPPPARGSKPQRGCPSPQSTAQPPSAPAGPAPCATILPRAC